MSSTAAFSTAARASARWRTFDWLVSRNAAPGVDRLALRGVNEPEQVDYLQDLRLAGLLDHRLEPRITGGPGPLLLPVRFGRRSSNTKCRRPWAIRRSRPLRTRRAGSLRPSLFLRP